MLALTAIATLLVGCTSAPLSPGQSSIGKPTTHEVTVKRQDIFPVLSLAAEVRSDFDFQVTAPVGGTFGVEPDGQMRVVDDGGVVHPIEVPAGAHVTTVVAFAGQHVAVGLPLATATYTSFALVAPILGADLLRFTTTPISAKAQIDSSGAPFACVFVDDRPTSLDGAKDEHFMACQIPETQPVIVGMTGIVAFRFPGARNVLTLPIEAVAGSIQDGMVTKLADGKKTQTKVGLGVTDGLDIEVTSGLKEGDVVLIPSPSLLHG